MKIKKIIIPVIAILLFILSALVLFIYNAGLGTEPPTTAEGTTIVKAADYAFDLDTAGPPEGTPVLLLHGFPESSLMWLPVMEELAGQGYYCAAFNQRGYSPGARPGGASSYTIEILAADVIAVADALGFEKFHLIGHDWGSAVGWAVAATYPRRLSSFTSLSVPHLSAWSQAYREDQEQYAASEYIRLFQLPLLPEFFLAKENYAGLKQIWKNHPQEQQASYLKLFRQKKALTATLNWYRGNFKKITEGFELAKIEVPTLFLWGNQDPALTRYGAELTAEYVSGAYRFVELEAGHFLLTEVLPEVLDEITQQLEEH